MRAFLLRVHATFSAIPAGPETELIVHAHLGFGIATALMLALATSMSFGASLAIGLTTFVVLTGCLSNRITVWLAAVLGTATVSAVAAGFGYLLGHAARTEAVPPIAATIGALLGGAWSIRAYARYLRALRRPDR